MRAQVYSLPDQTEGRRKAFLEGTSIDLCSNLSLACGGNDNYSKSVDTPWQFPKQISKFFFQMVVQVYFLLGQTEGQRKTFFQRMQEERSHCEITSTGQEHLVVIRDEKSPSFCKIRINSRPLYKQVLQGMEYYDKIVDRFEDLSKESYCPQGEGLIIT